MNSSKQGMVSVPRLLFFSFLFLFQGAAYASTAPFLAFTDLISGPDTGLGDGQGSGVVVTLWGQNLGQSQGDSKLYFTDSQGTKREVAHVYYWKNADGVAPSGPANLYASHHMQEIAFSIPDSAPGAGVIQIESGTVSSNTLPFTVRDGDIYHVKSGGSDSNNGSWAQPFLTVARAGAVAPAGSTIYIHDVDTGGLVDRGIMWQNHSASSTLEAQFSFVAFPGFQPKVTGQRAIEGYTVQGMVVSKLDIYASNVMGEDANGQPNGASIHFVQITFAIQSTKNGRAVANRVGDIPGGCATATQAAIVGFATFGDLVSNYKVYGNEIYDYGCNGSGKLTHTTYFTIRSNGLDLQVEPWEYAYNYLHGNKAKFGIHQFDQNVGCGNTTGPVRITNNVIVDQAGAGISIGSNCGWSMDYIVENNVLINTGMPAAWDGINPDTAEKENGAISIRDSGLSGTMFIRNNFIYGYSTQGQTNDVNGCLSHNGSLDLVSIVWSNNICYTDIDQPFVGAANSALGQIDNVTGSNNIWHYAGNATPVKAVLPAWVGTTIQDHPALTINGHKASMAPNSPARDKGHPQGAPERDIYGTARGAVPDIGAIEFLSKPNPPTGLSITSN